MLRNPYYSAAFRRALSRFERKHGSILLNTEPKTKEKLTFREKITKTLEI